MAEILNCFRGGCCWVWQSSLWFCCCCCWSCCCCCCGAKKSLRDGSERKVGKWVSVAMREESNESLQHWEVWIWDWKNARNKNDNNFWTKPTSCAEHVGVGVKLIFLELTLLLLTHIWAIVVYQWFYDCRLLYQGFRSWIFFFFFPKYNVGSMIDTCFVF